MGTRFELVLAGEDAERLVPAGEAALERIEEADRAFSRFDPASLLAHVRRVAPAPVPVDADTFALFTAADRIREASDRAFDVRPGGTVLLDEGARTIAVPDGAAEIDLGAIAKGFALDWAGAILREAGAAAAFLHGGTSSALGIGAPPGEQGWKVALGDRPGAPVVTLRDRALSLAAARTRRDGEPAQHVRDHRTGAPVPGERRVAVIGPSAGWADGWSTAVLVLGRRPAAMPGGWEVWLEDPPAGWTELAPRRRVVPAPTAWCAKWGSR